MRYSNVLPSKWRLLYLYDLLRSLVNRDMKLLYKRSALGVAWTLISPLLQLAVFAIVFQRVLAINVPQYSSFVFIGLLVWAWFQNSLFQATGVIVANRALIRQPNFPSVILPIVTVTTGLVHFILAMPILIAFLYFDDVQFQPVILYLPLLQILQFVFTVGLAYLLAALNVTFRDTQHTLGVLLQLWFYLTPIFYDLKTIPEEFAVLFRFNPMVSIVQSYRAILLEGTAPDWTPLLIIAASTAILLPIGHQVFKHQSYHFVEEI
ncbi:MAG: ABC transporter permease [Microcoleus sp. SIO2G3]|nr:ABC transporter permease [Microcoleus sp. SIO2G3]